MFYCVHRAGNDADPSSETNMKYNAPKGYRICCLCNGDYMIRVSARRNGQTVKLTRHCSCENGYRKVK